MKLGVLLGALALSLTASVLVPAEAEAAHRHDRYCRHERSRSAQRYRHDDRSSRYDNRNYRYDNRAYRYGDRYDDRRYSRYDDRYGYGDYGYGSYDYGNYDYDYRYRRSYRGYGYGPRISVRPYVYLSPGRYRHRYRYWSPRLGVHIGGRHLGLYLGF